MGKASSRKQQKRAEGIATPERGKAKQKKSSGKLIKDILTTLLYAIILAALIKGLVFDSRAIPTASMEPTIMTNDRVIMSRLAYVGNKGPQRGDIVVFTPPEELGEKLDLIKRVIGLPGDTLEVRDGQVYINNDPLDEPYLTVEPDYTYGPIEVPEDSYFMMGDNRNVSVDSHRWNDPFINKKDIKGKAICTYWPLSRIGVLE